MNLFSFTTTATFVFLLSFSDSFAIAYADTIKQDSDKYQLRVVARMHSLSFFGYGGVIVNKNTAADVNFTYYRKRYGAMFIKAFDLQDIHGSNNFALAAAYARIDLSKKFSITPYVGASIGQCRKFVDPGSDAVLLLINSWRVTDQFTIEHCARLTGIVMQPENFDWLNRFRFIYAKDHLDLMLMFWNNTAAFDDAGYTTMGLNAAFARMKVSERLTLSTGITAIVVADLYNENKDNFNNGLMLSIAASLQ
jgi:hypothetical protein